MAFYIMGNFEDDMHHIFINHYEKKVVKNIFSTFAATVVGRFNINAYFPTFFFIKSKSEMLFHKRK